MRGRRKGGAALAMLLGTGSIMFQGCPLGELVGPIVSDCFGEETISQSAYDDLNVLEQLLYEENDCGRYEPVSNVLDDIL